MYPFDLPKLSCADVIVLTSWSVQVNMVITEQIVNKKTNNHLFLFFFLFFVFFNSPFFLRAGFQDDSFENDFSRKIKKYLEFCKTNF